MDKKVLAVECFVRIPYVAVVMAPLAAGGSQRPPFSSSPSCSVPLQ
jgi:hypothetical protein